MRPSLIRNGLWVARPACKTSLISVAAQSAPSPLSTFHWHCSLWRKRWTNQPSKLVWRSCSLGSSGAKKAQFPLRGRGAVDPSQLTCAHQNQNRLKMPTTQPKFDQQTSKLVLPGMRCNGDPWCWPTSTEKLITKIEKKGFLWIDWKNYIISFPVGDLSCSFSSK